MTIDNITCLGKFDKIKRTEVLQNFISVCERIKNEVHNIISNQMLEGK